MKRVVKKLLKIFLVFLMIYSLGLSVGYYNKINLKSDVVNIYLNSKNTSSDFTQLKNNNLDSKYTFVVSRQEDNVSIKTPEFNTSYNSDVVFINGDSGLIVDGPILFSDDTTGCLIDSDTAYNLFGSTNVIGQKIAINDREVYIRGIHKGQKKTVIVQELNSSNEPMEVVSLKTNANKYSNSKEYVETFAVKYGINTDSVDNKVYQSFGGIFTFLLPISMIIVLLNMLRKQYVKDKNKPVLKAIYVVTGISVIAVFKLLGKISFSIPLDLLPNQWSNFEFWGDMIKKYQEKIEFYVYMKKYNIDKYLIAIDSKITLYSILAIILFILVRKYIRIKNKKQLYILVIISLVLSFITVLMVSSSGLNCYSITIWCLFPVYIILEYFILRMRQKLVSKNEGVVIKTKSI